MRHPFNPHKIDTKFAQAVFYGIHEGLDVNGLGGGNTDCGTLLYPIFEGEIVHTSEGTKDYGNLIVYKIDGPWGTRYIRYAHCLEFLKKSGRCVEADPIAKMGSTGNSTACHLHWDILKKQPPKWRFYTKDQNLFVEYFEDPLVFMESWKNYMPPVPIEFPYRWLEDFAHEKNIAKNKIEGWVREMFDKARQTDTYQELATMSEKEKRAALDDLARANGQIETLEEWKIASSEELKLKNAAIKSINEELTNCVNQFKNQSKKETFWQILARWLR